MSGEERVRTLPGTNGRMLTRRGWGMGIPWFVALLVAVTLPLPSGIAAPGAKMVGVVDFYAPTPLGSFEGVIPERFAADDLANLLTRATRGGVTVIPRTVIEQAETAIGWREEDALRFARLSALAHAVGADSLIVGWITMLTVSGGGHGITFPPDDGDGCCTGDAWVVVQIFDAAQGRIVAETRQWASTMGIVRALVAKQVLHEALEPTIPPLVRMLAAGVP